MGIGRDTLRSLLSEGRIGYILVGNSIGGLNVRLFAFRYPGEVAGLVLVDPAHEGQFARMPATARIDPSFIRMLRLFRIGSRFGLLRLLNMPLGEASSPLLPERCSSIVVPVVFAGDCALHRGAAAFWNQRRQPITSSSARTADRGQPVMAGCMWMWSLPRESGPDVNTDPERGRGGRAP